MEYNSEDYEKENKLEGVSYSKHYRVFLFVELAAVGGFIFSVGYYQQASLLFYHSYLISYNLSTWESASAHKINYMKAYPLGHMPFDNGLGSNLKTVFLHGNKLREWVLPDLEEAWRQPRFNYCVNKHYSCC